MRRCVMLDRDVELCIEVEVSLNYMKPPGDPGEEILREQERAVLNLAMGDIVSRELRRIERELAEVGEL